MGATVSFQQRRHYRSDDYFSGSLQGQLFASILDKETVVALGGRPGFSSHLHYANGTVDLDQLFQTVAPRQYHPSPARILRQIRQPSCDKKEVDLRLLYAIVSPGRLPLFNSVLEAMSSKQNLDLSTYQGPRFGTEAREVVIRAPFSLWLFDGPLACSYPGPTVDEAAALRNYYKPSKADGIRMIQGACYLDVGHLAQGFFFKRSQGTCPLKLLLFFIALSYLPPILRVHASESLRHPECYGVSSSTFDDGTSSSNGGS